MTYPTPSLHVVIDHESDTPPLPTRIQRIRDLKSQVAQLTREHVQHLLQQLAETTATALEIAQEDSFAPGIRDLARRYADDTQARAETMGAIAGRLS